MSDHVYADLLCTNKSDNMMIEGDNEKRGRPKITWRKVISNVQNSLPINGVTNKKR